MSSPSMNLSLLFIFILIISFVTSPISATPRSLPSIGVTYTNRGNTHLPHQLQKLIPILQTLKINSIRLPDSDPDIIRSFSYSGISLLLSIPNSFIPQIADNQSEALRWLNRHVTPFYPRVHISTISVGNNVVSDLGNGNVSDVVIYAMRSVRESLDELGITKISVSTSFSFTDVITTAFPPSSGEFHESVTESLMKPVLQFLAETHSPFLISVYPYELYRTEPTIPLGYALFEEPAFMYRDDTMSGVRYRNLFDSMVDSVITAIAKLGHENIPVIVTETGWPNIDETKDVDADRIYAEMYIRGLVRHVKSGRGTPLRKEGVPETYVFELFDNSEINDTSEIRRQWGILNQDMTQKYNIDFSGSDQTDCADAALLLKIVILYVIWELLF
ncbi:hypothetical protein ACHQM5_019964 [Ranunculus cassubicifolius]